MNITVLSTICLIASMTIFAFTIVFCVGIHEKRKAKHNLELKKGVFALSSFHLFIIGVFVSTVLMYFPINFTTIFPEGQTFTRAIKGLLLSLYNAFQVFVLEGDYGFVIEQIKGVLNLNKVVTQVYTVYMLILFVIEPYITASFVLSFFKNISASARYLFNRSKNIYYISQLNERSFALAVNIIKESEKSKTKPLILFFDVSDETSEDGDDLASEAKRIGAICFKKSITEIGFKAYKKCKRKLYFIGLSEDANLKHGLQLIKKFRESEKLNNHNNEFYIFATSQASETLIDSADNGALKVRRIHSRRNLVLRTLIENPIFENYYEEDGVKKLNILIVGFGRYGIEFLKALCWSGQMIGYELTINIIDASDDIKSKVELQAPELISHNAERIDGEPYYNIRFFEKVDINGEEFKQTLLEIDQITSCYVVLGDDELNIDTAIKIATLCERNCKIQNWVRPEISAVVYNSVKHEIIDENKGLETLNGIRYPIRLIGDRITRYTTKMIEMQELEYYATKCHTAWAETEDEKKQAQESFERYEYYRRSSLAMAMHLYFVKKYSNLENCEIDNEEDDVYCKLEHTRWKAFMRSEGFVRGDKKDFLAKTHQDLRKYTQLTNKDKVKDANVVCSLKDEIDVKKFNDGQDENIDKYQNIARDFVNKYPFSAFLTDAQLDRSTACVKASVNINCVLIGFNDVNANIFLTSVATNQFITKTQKGIDIKQVNYHIFSRGDTANDNLCVYYACEKAMGKAHLYGYLPFPDYPANECYYDLDGENIADQIKRITSNTNDLNIVIVATQNQGYDQKVGFELAENYQKAGKNNCFVFIYSSISKSQRSPYDNCKIFGDISEIDTDDLVKMAKLRNVIYEFDGEKQLDKIFKRASDIWESKTPLEKQSSLTAVTSLRFKLNLLGFDIGKESNENGEGEDALSDYKDAYNNCRDNLAFEEHLRWNAFMIANGFTLSTIDQILTEKVGENFTNGKNLSEKRHGNLTTFDGLKEFAKLIAKRDKTSVESRDVIKYDYQILDEVCKLLQVAGYKIIKKS